MVKFRIIAVLLILDGKIVQSEKFLHTNTIHYDVEIFTSSLNEWCVDEIIVLDVSKKKDHKSFIKNVLKISKKCFVPLSIGGWVNNFNYAKELFNSGADKIVVNSLLHSNLKLVDKIASKYGVQSIIASVDYKLIKDKKKIFIDRGKKKTDFSPEKFCQKISKHVGEILLTSIDHEGMMNGYDTKVLTKVSKSIKNPIIIFGGAYKNEHFLEGIKSGANAVAAANVFHYKELATLKLNRYLKNQNIHVRKIF